MWQLASNQRCLDNPLQDYLLPRLLYRETFNSIGVEDEKTKKEKNGPYDLGNTTISSSYVVRGLYYPWKLRKSRKIILGG